MTILSYLSTSHPLKVTPNGTCKISSPESFIFCLKAVASFECSLFTSEPNFGPLITPSIGIAFGCILRGELCLIGSARRYFSRTTRVSPAPMESPARMPSTRFTSPNPGDFTSWILPAEIMAATTSPSETASPGSTFKKVSIPAAGALAVNWLADPQSMFLRGHKKSGQTVGQLSKQWLVDCKHPQEFDPLTLPYPWQNGSGIPSPSQSRSEYTYSSPMQ
mmetsp:Transcript_44123/g.82037  ORF Transcript_44123/g.82037 Transcript_44123/m.82037 type:complete len:220 (-) Transcript_44123:465-1124(-)